MTKNVNNINALNIKKLKLTINITLIISDICILVL
jgi:hypothetical protein